MADNENNLSSFSNNKDDKAQNQPDLNEDFIVKKIKKD